MRGRKIRRPFVSGIVKAKEVPLESDIWGQLDGPRATVEDMARFVAHEAGVDVGSIDRADVEVCELGPTELGKLASGNSATLFNADSPPKNILPS